MHDPLTEDLLLPIPEEPWWWPLGPTGFVVAMFAGVTWISWTWPIQDAALEMLRDQLKGMLAILVVLWLALGLWLRRRRRGLAAATLRVGVSADGLVVGERQLSWTEVSACEWSPFGLVLEIDGRREHVPARISDAQVTRLTRATEAAR